MSPTSAFHRCTCGTKWANRNDFLSDPDIRLVGYQPDFEVLKLGLLLFNHEICRTTIGCRVEAFADLQEGPTFSVRLTGTPECPGFCLHPDELRPCDAPCECAWVRRLLPVVEAYPKAGSAAGGG